MDARTHLAVGNKRVHGALAADAPVATAQKHRVRLAVKAQQAEARHGVFLGRELSSEFELQNLVVCGRTPDSTKKKTSKSREQELTTFKENDNLLSNVFCARVYYLSERTTYFLLFSLGISHHQLLLLLLLLRRRGSL